MRQQQRQRRVIPRRGSGNFHEPANISQLCCFSVFLGSLGLSRPANSKVLLSCREMLWPWRLSHSAWEHQGQSKGLSSTSPGVLPQGSWQILVILNCLCLHTTSRTLTKTTLSLGGGIRVGTEELSAPSQTIHSHFPDRLAPVVHVTQGCICADTS